MPITLNTTLVRSDNILASPVENALVMMDIEGGQYFSLDEIGTAIWERLAEPIQVGNLCAQLTQTYEVLPEVCERDVLALLNEMAGSGLVLSRD